jgi:hypothetical protein
MEQELAGKRSIVESGPLENRGSARAIPLLADNQIESGTGLPRRVRRLAAEPRCPAPALPAKGRRGPGAPSSQSLRGPAFQERSAENLSAVGSNRPDAGLLLA